MRVFKHYVNRYREALGAHLWSKRWLRNAQLHQERLGKMKNQFAGQRAFLIGNGPSINQQPLESLKDECTFACNSFFLKGEEIGITPMFYVVEDKFVAEDNSTKIESLNYPTKLFPRDLRYCLPSENNVFLNFVRYYSRPSHPEFPKFWSPQSPFTFYWGGTVIYLAIQLAVFMGFEQIYLIGIDLSYQIPENIEQDGDKLTSLEDDSNHFHPDYFGKGKRWHLPETERMQHCFEKAYAECSSAGVELFNATHGGNLAVIPRVDYSTLF